MVKNALQAQLLKAGLVDNKKAKKLSKQAVHEKRTGESKEAEIKAKIEQDKLEKQAKDLAIEQAKKAQLQEKELNATIVQMINQHKIRNTDGEISYQFIDENKIKKIYINQQIYNALVAGSLVIAKENDGYAILPKALADRINSKMEGFILVNNSQSNDTATTDEEDPYAAYVIPDDLMW
ncbi:DUF2058 domain-containing protein [Acinetobacter equi]|uniref:Nucleoprotein/polynucleotide-associated enzyme n=1 Tax=Acinetobacter equi TaxID=1324350 RepID=A0A0N9VXI3_9GAMM|nr:DUF2058 domain-containing protein [Acinetobacter equi]ALH96006.1 hypothetical protein AOY20_10955 [Acinetobacter equi]